MPIVIVPVLPKNHYEQFIRIFLIVSRPAGFDYLDSEDCATDRKDFRWSMGILNRGSNLIGVCIPRLARNDGISHPYQLEYQIALIKLPSRRSRNRAKLNQVRKASSLFFIQNVKNLFLK